MHSARLKTTITPQSATTAAEPFSERPTTRIVAQVTANSAAVSASAGKRLRPSSAFAIGSCAITSTIVLTKKTTPIPAGLTPACSFAYGGRIVATCA